MKSLILALFFSTNAFAVLEHISVSDLDLDYAAPQGLGTAKKVKVGIYSEKSPVPYPIEVVRTEDSYQLITPYVDFTWLRPAKFFHNLRGLKAVKTDFVLGLTGTHTAQSEFLSLLPETQGEFKLQNLEAKCEGNSTGRFEERLLQDCRKFMDFKIQKVDVPEKVLRGVFLAALPEVPREDKIPANNVIVSVKEGDLYLQLYIKYWFYAGLRAWGHVQLEENNKVIAVRVDQVKFGYLGITNLAFRKLKEAIKSPAIEIQQPWIRIHLDR